jgi:Methyl-accepting chemotaxis protein
MLLPDKKGGYKMKNKLRIQHRLILPIVLLGVVALISNVLAVFNINNVNANAANIVDNYMVGTTKLDEIRRSISNTHKMALSHIIAEDYNTMITVVTQMKQEEKNLNQKLKEYKSYVTAAEDKTYQELLKNYEAFKHALVYLICASADSKTQDAYAYANGDVADFGNAIESDINKLESSIKAQTTTARNTLSRVYITSLTISVISIMIGLILVLASISIIMKYVIKPFKSILYTLQGSSDRINNVVSEVLKRAKTSNKSTKDLSSLTGALSAAIQKVASNASIINSSAADVKRDVNDTADECGAITKYSIAMKARAKDMEQSAQTNMEIMRAKVSNILTVLNEAIEDSRSVDQVNLLTKDILQISASTNIIALNASVEAARVGAAGKGFAVVAEEIRQLADSCGETANRIQEVNKIVTSAVHNLSKHSQDLVDYLSESILAEFQEFVNSGKQYKDDAAYIEQAMDEFQNRTDRLKQSMIEIADSIGSITKAIDDGAAGITGAADSTQSLAADMADISNRMDMNQEIVEELQKQTKIFANL